MKSNHGSDKVKCFVCEQEINTQHISYNKKLNLPVCENCMKTEKEKEAEKKAIETLGEDFICGCI
jgi:protein-arginine kinase activator protein McsA